jgi:putative ubiquitin-RnfH superfamily antitoxin RatB of RatAB toxin-antitoxin module
VVDARAIPQGLIEVEVVMAWPRRFEAMVVTLPEGATVADAVAAAALAHGDAVDGYAIFGVKATARTPLRSKDRLELLRPLQADPKDARRRRAAR